MFFSISEFITFIQSVTVSKDVVGTRTVSYHHSKSNGCRPLPLMCFWKLRLKNEPRLRDSALPPPCK